MKARSLAVMVWLVLALPGVVGAQLVGTHASEKLATAYYGGARVVVAVGAPSGVRTQFTYTLAARLDSDLRHRKPKRAWNRQDSAYTWYRRAVEAMDDGNYREAARSFGRIHRQFPRSTYTPDSFYWHAFALYRLGGDDNLRTAVELLTMQQYLHQRAATATDGLVLATRMRGHLAMEGDEVALRELGEALENANSCSRSGASVRIAAMSAFQRIDPTITMKYLRRTFGTRESCSEYLREQSVFILAQLQSAEATQMLLDLARDSRELDVRNQALHWLSHVPDSRSFVILEDVLRGSLPLRLKESALFALSQLASVAQSGLFREIAASRLASIQLRTGAVRWLAQQELESNTDWIRQLYVDDRSPAMRRIVVGAIASRSSLSDRSWLLQVARDTSATVEVRRMAASSAAELQSTTSELYELYHSVTVLSLREHIIDLLARNRESLAVERLIDIATLDSVAELRITSLGWLRKSRDPRAVAFVSSYRERN
jgi:hypothetical protein